jgi:hypothetical protein
MKGRDRHPDIFHESMNIQMIFPMKVSLSYSLILVRWLYILSPFGDNSPLSYICLILKRSQPAAPHSDPDEYGSGEELKEQQNSDRTWAKHGWHGCNVSCWICHCIKHDLIWFIINVVICKHGWWWFQSIAWLMQLSQCLGYRLVPSTQVMVACKTHSTFIGLQ